MSYDVGFNFRSTSGYVSDAANEVYVLAESYPTTRSNANGNSATFGWESGGLALNRSASVDRRLAGVNYAGSGTSGVFRVDLPATGDTDIYFAGGDTGGSNVSAWDFEDTTTAFQSLNKAASSDNYIDASGVVRTEASWPADNAVLTRTFSTTIFRLRDQAAGNNVFAHLRVVQAGSPPLSIIPLVHHHRQLMGS